MALHAVAIFCLQCRQYTLKCWVMAHPRMDDATYLTSLLAERGAPANVQAALTAGNFTTLATVAFAAEEGSRESGPCSALRMTLCQLPLRWLMLGGSSTLLPLLRVALRLSFSAFSAALALVARRQGIALGSLASALI